MCKIIFIVISERLLRRTGIDIAKPAILALDYIKITMGTSPDIIRTEKLPVSIASAQIAVDADG